MDTFLSRVFYELLADAFDDFKFVLWHNTLPHTDLQSAAV